MANILENSMDYLAQFDPEIASQMQSEYQRQQRNIELIASENIASPAVIAAMGSVLTNKYAEGWDGSYGTRSGGESVKTLCGVMGRARFETRVCRRHLPFSGQNGPRLRPSQ